MGVRLISSMSIPLIQRFKIMGAHEKLSAAQARGKSRRCTESAIRRVARLELESPNIQFIVVWGRHFAL